MSGRRAAFLAAALVGVAAPAAAATGDGGSNTLLWQTVNLVVLLAALVYFARKPIQAFFADRRARIQEQLESASRLQSEAESRYATWQRKLADLDDEIRSIRSVARERAEAERASLLADAAAAAERIRREAGAAVEREVQRARERLREEAGDLAVELAARLLRERVTDSDRERLVDEFIERLERGNGAAGEAQ